MINNEKWLTVNEATKLSGYHPEHIRELVRAGKLIARKFSIVWQIDRESLLRYLAEAKNSSDRRHGPKLNKS